jgi:transcriptional regulator with XRE-family HTH domain
MSLRKKMSVFELAQKVGCSSSHLSKIEHGERNMALDLLMNIAQSLGVSSDYLLTGGSIRNGKDTYELDEIIRLAFQLKQKQ